MKCPAPALIHSELSYAQEAVANILFDFSVEIGDEERGQIMLALSDHVVACEVIASTLRKASAPT